jgi:cytochrome c-type biogenesis protein CcmH
LAARVKPGVPLFVSARQPGIPGPPLAALRLSSEALPVTVALGDANAMIEGRNLSSVDEVEVTARVAFGGTAMTTPGDLVGSGRSHRGDAEQIEIVIDRQAP